MNLTAKSSICLSFSVTKRLSRYWNVLHLYVYILAVRETSWSRTFSERHYQRISRLLLNTTFVDYVCQMAKLKPLSFVLRFGTFPLCKGTNWGIFFRSSDINPSAESKNQVKLHRSALPAVHPLKQKPLECRLKKRSRKPDSDPFSNDDVDSEIMTPQKTVSNAESPVKRMRLRSAKKPDVRNRILRK